MAEQAGRAGIRCAAIVGALPGGRGRPLAERATTAPDRDATSGGI